MAEIRNTHKETGKECKKLDPKADYAYVCSKNGEISFKGKKTPSKVIVPKEQQTSVGEAEVDGGSAPPVGFNKLLVHRGEKGAEEIIGYKDKE